VKASEPSPEPVRDNPASPRLQKPRGLFRKAFERLRGEAEDQARRSLARDFDEIRKADDTIVEIAAKLPRSAREALAEIRTGLTKRLMRLRHLDGQSERGDKDRHDPR